MTLRTKLYALVIAGAVGLGLGLTSAPQPAQAQWGVYVGPSHGYHHGWRHQRRWDNRNYYRGYRNCVQRRPIWNKRHTRVVGWRNVNVCR